MRMHRQALLAASLAATLFDTESFAEPEKAKVRVHLSLEAASPAGSRPVAGRIVVTGGGSPSASVEASAPGVVELMLQFDQAIRLQAEFPGWWSPVVDLNTPTTDVSIELVPAAKVQGVLNLPAGETQFPSALEIVLEEVPKPLKGQGGAVTFAPPKRLAGVDCPVLQGGFACVVPAGSVHFSLRARGYGTTFFWQQSLQPGATKNLGTIALVRGASLIGWAVSESAPHPGSIQVSLEVSSGGVPTDPAKLALRRQTTTARADGFFEFSGLAPGAYSLVARLAGFEESRQDGIIIAAGSETRLGEPFVLYRPTPFEVMITPPVAPSGALWQVALVGGAGDAAEVREARGAAEVSGRFAARGLVPGGYRLEVRDDLDNTAHREEVRVAARADPVWVALEIVEIRGTLSLGRAPLPEQDFSLYGATGSEIKFRTDEKGTYAGYVTAPGHWYLHVGEGFRSGWARQLVAIPKRGGRVDFRIPAGQIRGVVVDEDGQPVSEADVALMQAVPVFTTSAADGSFTLQGLEEISHKLLASSSYSEQASGVVETKAVSDPEADPIRVTLRPGVRVQGRVRDANGPLSAAQITVCGRAAGLPGGLSCDQTQTAEGRFAVTVAQAADGVTWIAQVPGYALEVGAGSPSLLDEIVLDQEGATLTLRYPKKRAGGYPIPPLLLQVGTGPINTAVLFRWANGQGQRMETDATGSTIRIPMIEAGTYAFCDLEDGAERLAAVQTGQASHDHCAVGVVAPFGEIVLTLPDPAP